MEEPKISSDMIADPGFPSEQIDVETYMNRQGWSRGPSMRGKNLDSFVDGSNALLIKRVGFAHNYGNGSTEKKNVLLWGSPGRGKTHLARGMMELAARNGERGIYWPLMKLISKLKAMMQKNDNPDSYIEWLSNFPGLLIIDETGRSRGGDWDRDNVLYPLADRRQDKRTIWISNYSPDQLTDIYDEAIVSRLTAGHVVSFGNGIDDYRGR